MENKKIDRVRLAYRYECVAQAARSIGSTAGTLRGQLRAMAVTHPAGYADNVCNGGDLPTHRGSLDEQDRYIRRLCGDPAYRRRLSLSDMLGAITSLPIANQIERLARVGVARLPDLGDACTAPLTEDEQQEYNRGLNGMIYAPVWELGQKFIHTPAGTNWIKGKPRGYRAENHLYICAVGRVLSCGTQLEWCINDQTGMLAAPEGWYWSCDTQGIQIISRDYPDCDYHVTAADVYAGDVDGACSDALVNWSTRAVAAAEADLYAEIERRGWDDVYVILADSVGAGNCETGTRTWCDQHDIGADQAVHAADVMLSAGDNGSSQRARLACRFAARRQAEYAQVD